MEKSWGNATDVELSAVLDLKKHIVALWAEEHRRRDTEKQNRRTQLSVTEAVGVICLGEGSRNVSEMRLERLGD